RRADTFRRRLPTASATMSTVPNWPWPQPVIANSWRRVAGVARQPDGAAEATGGCFQMAQCLLRMSGASAGEGPRDRPRCVPAPVSAADGSGDSAELARGHDLPHEREGTGLLVGELPDQPGPQPGQQLAEPYRIGVHGERVVDHGL